MTRKQTHTHPCEFEKNGCANTIECDGEYERNFDGFPEAVCDLYHLDDGWRSFACEACSASMCVKCGSIVRLEDHDEDCAEMRLA